MKRKKEADYNLSPQPEPTPPWPRFRFCQTREGAIPNAQECPALFTGYQTLDLDLSGLTEGIPTNYRHLIFFLTFYFVLEYSQLILCDPIDCSPPGTSVMGLYQQEYWSVLPSPPPRDLPSPGIEPASPASPALQADSSPLSHRSISN